VGNDKGQIRAHDSDEAIESTGDSAGHEEYDTGTDAEESTPDEPGVGVKLSDSERVKQLESEVARLRGGLAGAAEVIQEIENPPMPPIVGEDFVIPDHLVSDFVRLGRQLHREGMVKATQGAIAILDPDQPGLVHSTSKSCALSQATELDIVSGRLGQAAPPGAPDEWRVMEILIAATSLHNGGPAACIHVQPPYATTVAMEKDRIVLQPIDHYGKENLGKAVIVDPDLEDMDEYLRQVAEALQQGNMKCVVIRGLGVFAVGRNFNEAWHWAATLEHSMQVQLLARQAGMKT
jgi:ribulose-5-phosphate 4-epimerase/fuculose-1-phosphate aldolase